MKHKSAKKMHTIPLDSIQPTTEAASNYFMTNNNFFSSSDSFYKPVHMINMCI